MGKYNQNIKLVLIIIIINIIKTRTLVWFYHPKWFYYISLTDYCILITDSCSITCATQLLENHWNVISHYSLVFMASHCDMGLGFRITACFACHDVGCSAIINICRKYHVITVIRHNDKEIRSLSASLIGVTHWGQVTYMHHLTESSLGRVMPCRLFRTNPSPEPMLNHLCKFEPQELELHQNFNVN